MVARQLLLGVGIVWYNVRHSPFCSLRESWLVQIDIPYFIQI